MLAISQANFQGHWDDVRLFLALYRKRTLAGAAATVGLDASTLSRRLLALEESLDTRLFDRTRQGLAPTEGADLLLPAAEEMAAAHARFARDASAFERNAEGVVRLSVPPGLAETFVAPSLVLLREKYPRIRVELDASIRFVDLTRREADIALRTRRPEAGDLVSMKLGERRWIPMVSSQRSKRRKPVKDWSELAWIGWGDDMASFPPARWLTKHVPRSAVVLRASSFTVQVSAAETGVGVALLPEPYARLATLAPLSYTTKLAPSASELPTNETWLVGHRALRTVPRVAALWTFLVERFAAFEPKTIL
jgi:DNA-binding transcriptional LysR family regulator